MLVQNFNSFVLITNFHVILVDQLRFTWFGKRFKRNKIQTDDRTLISQEHRTMTTKKHFDELVKKAIESTCAVNQPATVAVTLAVVFTEIL